MTVAHEVVPEGRLRSEYAAEMVLYWARYMGKQKKLIKNALRFGEAKSVLEASNRLHFAEARYLYWRKQYTDPFNTKQRSA
jgi:hypothetical protein